MKTPSFFLAILLLTSLPLSAQEEEVAVRPYAGISGGNLIFFGSYDGSSFFQTEEDIILVPKISPGFGIGAVLGVSMGHGSGEIGYYYYRSHYTTLDAAYQGECTIHLFRILAITRYLKAYAAKRISPFIDVEMSGSHSVFQKIAYPIGQNDQAGPGSYGALIFGLGFGLRFRLGEHLTSEWKLLADYYIGTDVRKKGQTRYEIEKFGNLVLHSNLSMKYFFKPL